MANDPGMVYLVGVGPGDPDLITLRGHKLLCEADVVLYDRLIAPGFILHAAPHAELIDVGKTPGESQCQQDDIHALMIDRAKAGRRVVRLQGGDPFVFGRGFEELAACYEAGVPCVVVPGISSALAGPGASLIPLTHRGLARSVGIITGKSASADDNEIDFQSLASLDTVVIMMGRANLPLLTQGLIAAGRSGDTPAACVEWATTPRQRVIRATLATLSSAAQRQEISSPVITIIGEVVALHENLQAKAASPLFGKRIITTRPVFGVSTLNQRLSAYGATVISCPLIEIQHLSHGSKLDEYVRNLEAYDWILFTSVYGVEAFWRALQRNDLDARVLGDKHVAVVGEATKSYLYERGRIVADVVPERYTADSLVQALGKMYVSKVRGLFYPRSDKASSMLVEKLRERGLKIDDVIAYENRPVTPSPSQQLALEQGADIITFASPTAVRRFAELKISIKQANIACIGPVTSKAAKFAGLKVSIEASQQTEHALAEAIVEYFQK